jgi:hypothetical protein
LGLDRTAARLTLPCLPAIHVEDGSQRGESLILPLVRFQSGRSRDARSDSSPSWCPNASVSPFHPPRL